MPTNANVDHPPLLAAVAAGEARAAKQFIDRYGPLVWGILGRTLTEARAHVAARSIFRDLIGRAGEYSRESLPEVILVASVVHRHLAAVADRDPVDIKHGSINISPCVRGTQELVAVSRSLIALPHEQKRAIELCVLQGLSTDQVAQKMSLNTNTVRRYLRRGLQRARGSFGGGRATSSAREEVSS